MKRRILESESMLSRLPRRALGFAAAASVGVAVLFGCGSPDDGAGNQSPQTTASGKHGKSTSTANGSSAAGDIGSVGFDLKLGNANVDHGSYSIHGTGYDTSGPIDLSQAGSVSVVVGGVPIASGYTANLEAHSTSTTSPMNCTGSATFDVTSPNMTSVTVPMDCHESLVVPVPRGASFALAALIAASGLLLLGGAARQRRRTV
jgi:hypothetical protein